MSSSHVQWLDRRRFHDAPEEQIWSDKQLHTAINWVKSHWPAQSVDFKTNSLYVVKSTFSVKTKEIPLAVMDKSSTLTRMFPNSTGLESRDPNLPLLVVVAEKEQSWGEDVSVPLQWDSLPLQCAVCSVSLMEDT